jgi:hypothetical protein
MTTTSGRSAGTGSRRILVGLCVAFGLVLAACSSGPPAKSANHKSHATTTTSPPATTLPGAAAAPCAGSALKGSEAAFNAAGVGGHAATVVVALTNKGAIACTLSGYPKLQLLDAAGKNLPTTLQQGGSGIESSLSVQTATLAANGGQASFQLYWVPTPSASEPTCTPAPKMTVSVPGSKTTISMTAEISACGGIVETSPFQPGVITVP